MAINQTSALLLPSNTTTTETWSGTSSGSQSIAAKSSSFQGLHSVGTDIPNYHAKVKSKVLLPITNWNQADARGSSSGTCQYVSAKYVSGVRSVLVSYTSGMYNTYHYNGISCSSPAFTTHGTDSIMLSAVDPDIVDNVVTSAVVKLTSSKHDSLTFLAELGKTVVMFKRVMSRVTTLMKQHDPQTWASIWLEGRYGWRTLIYDLESIDRALEHLSADSMFWKSSSNGQHTVHEQGDFSGTFLTSPITGSCSYSVDCSYRGFAIGKMKSPSFGGNIAVTAWELVPWSFVIDWFIDIGSKIAYAHSYLSGAEYKSGYGLLVTANGSFSASAGANSTPPSNGTRFECTSWSCSAEWSRTDTVRCPFTPSLVPNFDVDLNAFKIADLLALFVQVASK